MGRGEVTEYASVLRSAVERIYLAQGIRRVSRRVRAEPRTAGMAREILERRHYLLAQLTTPGARCNLILPRAAWRG